MLICLCMDKWAICGHFYSYVDLVWLLYNIGPFFHVIVQVVFCVDGGGSLFLTSQKGYGH